MASKNISKSKFIAGLQCEKRLWLEIHDRGLADEIDEQTQGIFDQGHEVGELAQTLYPGGVLIGEDHLHIPEAVKATEKAVKEGASDIYEATAIHDRYLARTDILHRVEPGANNWDIIEVKSSTKVKDEYLYDMAIQKYIFEGAGYHIRKTILCHINNQYVRQGKVALNEFFILSDETGQVNSLLKNITQLTERFLKIADSPKTPEIPIGDRCFSPYDCPFIGHCWKDIPKDSVFTLINGRELPEKLYKQGIIKIADIPKTVSLSPKQRRQVEVAQSGKPYWNQAVVTEFLEQLEYPIHFLDFEGYNPAIPPYDGISPFQQTPFQFSVHIQEAPGSKLVHHEFLPTGPGDPRESLVEKLLSFIGPNGSIVVYFATYETGIINNLAELFPKQKKSLNSLIARFRDLIVPFKSKEVLYPGFLGSASLKAVLPILVPEMTYEGMNIGEGGAASMAYVKLIDPEVSNVEKEKIRKDLLAYCGQDTLAMVKLVEVLKDKR